MNPRIFIVAILNFVLIFSSVSLWAGTQPIVTSDLLRIRSVTAIDVAKDGLRAVFAVRSIATVDPPPQNPDDPEAQPSYAYQSHLYLLDLSDAEGQVRQLTFGDRKDGEPRLSPDGKRIAFVRDAETSCSSATSQKPIDDEENSASQVWVIDVAGGEARQATNFEHGCGRQQWSPDGLRIMVSSSIPMDEMEGAPRWPMERPKRTWNDARPGEGVVPRPDGTRREIRAWLELNAQRENPNVINRIEFQDEQRLRGPIRFAQLFLIDPDSSSLPIEQSAARQITRGFYDHVQAVFMPDGQSIVYAAKKPVDQHIDRVLSTSLWRVDVESGFDRALLAVEGWSLEWPKPSRDGEAIAFSGQRMDEPAFRQTQLGIASIAGDTVGEPVWLTDESNFMGSVFSFEWMHLQPALVFNTAMRGGFPLMTVSPGLVQPAMLVGQGDAAGGLPVGVQAFGAGGPAVVYSVTSVSNPCVLKVRDGRGERMVHDLNPWVAEKNLSMPVGGEITRPDGKKVQYWLMEPTNRDAGMKYPLVLEIHGGPAGMWGPGEFTTWHEFQLLCSWGFGVVYSNPRGSGGYGYAFQKANFQDWGEGPAGDVLAALDQAALKEWVDPERLVVTGGSYAGYLTAWIIAHDRRFKAAVAQRGVYDFSTFYGEGNAWRLVGWAMGGPPHDARFKQAIDRNNIMNYVNRIRTPLLIKHASEDLRTGVSQSEMLYRALKDLGQPVEFVRYPGEGHDLSRTGDPLRRMDRLNRMIEFFERYVENSRSAPVASSNN